MKVSTVRGIVLCLAVGAAWPATGGVSPANTGLPIVSAYGQPGIPRNNASAMCVACHGFVPVTGGTAHFVASGTRLTNNPGAKERIVAWTGSGRASKYGNFATWTSDNTTAGEMICESCHNIVRNVAGGNNLLESSLPGDTRPAQPNTLADPSTTLCEGCHVTGALPGHHPTTGDTVSTTGQPLSNTDTGFTRGFVDPSTEVGGSGSGVFYPGANAVACLSCHGNGHGGYPGTGARIVRRGHSRDPLNPGAAVTGVDNTGIDRQADVAPRRLITNFTPLCDSCHRSND